MSNDEHVFIISYNVKDDILAIVDTMDNKALKMIKNSVFVNGIAPHIIWSHLTELQLLISNNVPVQCLSEEKSTPNVFEVKESFKDVLIKYDSEQAVYSENCANITENFNRIYALRVICQIADKVLTAAKSTQNAFSIFVHDRSHDLMIIEYNNHQVVGAWSQLCPGFLNGALVDGVPYQFVTFIPDKSYDKVTIMDDKQNILFETPYDVSAAVIFEEQGDPNVELGLYI